MNIIKLTQKGGLEPLEIVPKFKYTFNEERKLFISYVYPYAPYLINCITTIPFSSYSYNGNCEYINPEDKTQTILQCNSSDSPLYSPLYILNGGVVYEILNKKFNNINLHDYCDATGDIDVTVYPPKLTVNLDAMVYFLNVDGKISSFYGNFTNWIFNNVVKNIKSIQILFNNVPGFINFNIDEYEEIPNTHKTSDLGYNIEMIGKFGVVAFLNDDVSMFKIQVVCKIQDNNMSYIDHVIEIIIPLPESSLEFCPSADHYSQGKFNTIELNKQKFNVQSYNSLITNNIDAYLERKGAYGASNEKNVIHKSLNHIARLFYLYELIYRNMNDDLFKEKIVSFSLLFLFGMKSDKTKNLKFLYYYKIVNDNFFTIKVDTRFFLNSYLELIMKNKYTYPSFKKNNPNYFINETNLTDIQNIHNRFNIELFNDDLFEPSGLLTFNETTGGKRIKKSHKSKKTIKKTKNIRNKRNTRKQK